MTSLSIMSIVQTNRHEDSMKRLYKLFLMLMMVTIFNYCYYKCHVNVKLQNKSYNGHIKTRQRLARRKLRLQETCALLNTSSRTEYSSIYQRRAQDNEGTGVFFRLGGRYGDNDTTIY